MEIQEPAPNSDSDSSSSGSSEVRPGRWTGAQSTWRSLTEQERGLAASLHQLRNQDLSIHLYNAHSLKRHAREFSMLKKEGKEIGEDGEREGFAPSKGWTAWPLPPDLVPRVGEIVGPEDGDDCFTFRMREVERPSRDVEELLMAITMRFAKERFEGRAWVDSEDEMDDVGGGFGLKADAEEIHDVALGDSGEMEGDHLDLDGLDELEGEDTLNPSTSAPLNTMKSKTWMKPVVSADDEQSQDIVRPSIRHALSKLDDVLMALHHTRRTCRQYSFRPEANTDDEARVRKRPRGRPRKFENLTSRPKISGSSQAQEDDGTEHLTAKQTHRGRPQRIYERLENESRQDYLVRVARIQKKPLPAFAPPRTPDPPVSPSEISRKPPAKRSTSGDIRTARHKKLGLRDWSEVLGSAALAGFPADVIARATQRCADIFGDGMRMLTLVESPFLVKNSDLITTYQPDEIPDLDTEVEEPQISEEDIYLSRSNTKSSTSTSRNLKPRALPIRLQTYFCPIEDCPRKGHGLSYISGLRRHLLQYHKMTEEQAHELLDDSEEMDGAVHMDGFLKPLRQKRGMRGTDKRPRKRGRWPGGGTGDAEVHDVNDDETSSTDSDSEDRQLSESGISSRSSSALDRLHR